jgi:IPT/TIG domain/Glycosyltransferase WbsX
MRLFARTSSRPVVRALNAKRRCNFEFVGLAFLCVCFLTGCGGGGSDAPNPIPTITAISPTSAAREGSAFQLTVSGSGFVSGSEVQWNGGNRPTTFVSGTQLFAQISTADILVAGTDNITVSSPAPGGGTSNAVPFNIPCVIATPGPASAQTRARLGAYYFDGWAGPLTGFHFNGLVNSPYQGREPLSGWQDNNRCAIEQQLAWAHRFGIDFFVFDWYFNASVIGPTEDLNSALKITHSLSDRHGMQFAILYVDQPPFTIKSAADWTSAVQEWVGYMADPGYVRVNGKPLLVVIDLYAMREAFGSSAAVKAAFTELRTAAQARGLPGVTIVGGIYVADGAPAQDGLFPDLSMAVADTYDAVSLYSYAFSLPLSLSGAQPFSTLADTGKWIWKEEGQKSPLPVIPLLMDGLDPRSPEGDREPGRALYWFSRVPQDLATFVNDAITWAESNPKVRPEASPAPPMVLIQAWNELGNGSHMVPTVDDGTSYGDSLAAMLGTPPTEMRSVLTLNDSGLSDPNRTASGKLVDATGTPIAGASLTFTYTPASGAATNYQLSGQAPASAAFGVVGIRINVPDRLTLWPGFFYAGPGPSDVSVYRVSYVQPSDGIERVANSDFSSGGQSWTLKGQSQLVPSDLGAGQMVHVVATPNQFATLDANPFPVTAGAQFQLSMSARISTPSLGSGNFIVAFLDASGAGTYLQIPGPSNGALIPESVPFTPANLPLGKATTDANGQYQLSLSALRGSQATIETTYAGDLRHWPAYARVGP